MRAIAEVRRSFGYRRLHVLLKREGYLVNHMKLVRLYREERLAVSRNAAASGPFGPPNERWSLDFVSDQLTGGRRFRIPAVVDDSTRECLTRDLVPSSLKPSR